MSAPAYDLWAKLRDYPWNEDQVPRPLVPHPEPAVRSTVGDWLTEFGITSWKPAPQGWRLTQLYAEGHGIHATHGRPTRVIRSLVLAYFHTATARGATAILHYKAGAKKDGSGSWGFVEGLTWSICTEIDCEHDHRHLADLPKAAGANEIKALLKGETCPTGPDLPTALAEGSSTCPDSSES